MALSPRIRFDCAGRFSTCNIEIVGHKSLDIILTYNHVREEELVSAVDSVNFGCVVKMPTKAK